MLSNERTLKNGTMHTGEVDLRSLQFTAQIVSSPLTDTINNNPNHNNTKQTNLMDRFQSKSDLRHQDGDCEDNYTGNEIDMNNFNATNDM